MEHGSTCQFQWIGLQVIPQEVEDGPVLHPRCHHRICCIIHHDPDQFQHIWMGQTLPCYDFSAKVLRMIRFDRGESRSRCLTLLILLIPLAPWGSRLQISYSRMTLMATKFSSYFPRQTSEKPPVAVGELPSIWTFDSGVIYELGRMPCSPQIFTSPRKHRLLARRLIWILGCNICRARVGCVDGWIKSASYSPSRVSQPSSGPRHPPTVTSPFQGVAPPHLRDSVERQMCYVAGRWVCLAQCWMWSGDRSSNGGGWAGCL